MEIHKIIVLEQFARVVKGFEKNLKKKGRKKDMLVSRGEIKRNLGRVSTRKIQSSRTNKFPRVLSAKVIFPWQAGFRRCSGRYENFNSNPPGSSCTVA